MFITFEGGEGCGKSTQAKILAERLRQEGRAVVLTREPGGTQGAEQIRDLLLKGETTRWDPLTESLLYLASRADHWNKVIKPALDSGKIVISDRFHDSSVVYQGFCKGVSIELLNSVYNQITGGIYPDMTYIITIDPEIGIRRSMGRQGNEETRFEKMNLEFHKKVAQYFIHLSQTGKRYKLIDGNSTKEKISATIYGFLSYF